MLVISLVTLGSPEQLTGGYLYHRRMADAAPAHGARVEFASFPLWPFPLATAVAPAVLGRCRRADVVVVDSIAAALAAPWLAVAAARLPPLCAIAHQSPGGIDAGPVRRELQAALDRSAYRRCRMVLAASAPLAEELAVALPGADVRLVAPGRDVAEAAEGDVGDLRQGRRLALLCVGNWLARKGILELLDAVGRLPPDAVTLHLVGDPTVDPRYRARVEARLAAPDLRGRVVVHGPVSRQRVAAFYQGADTFALAATREPYGTVYGEAMANGLPVVGWRAGNLPHLASHEREGLMAEPGDVDGLAQAISRLAYDEDLRRRLAAGARLRAESLPTWADTAAAFFAALRQVAAG